MKEKLITWAIGAMVVLAAAAIPFGFIMGVLTDNPYWFYLCGFIVFFLS